MGADFSDVCRYWI